MAISLASDHPGNGVEKAQSAAAQTAAETSGYVWKTRLKPADSTTAAATNSEVFQNVVIAAGKNAIIQSSLDYSSSGIVAVAVLCSACTTSAKSLSSLGLVLEARWQPLRADTDIATENRSGSNFAYWDTGAAVFNVFAEQFNLGLQNKGTVTITLDQVTIFRRAQ